jgi:hypothetical protein
MDTTPVEVTEAMLLEETPELDPGMVTKVVTVTAVVAVTVAVEQGALDSADENSVLASATLKSAKAATRLLMIAIGTVGAVSECGWERD